MIHYKRCSEVDTDLVYKAFSIGFSDYIIKIQLSKEAFIDRFFGPEGNSMTTSFIALKEERPIGLVLGGAKNYEGIKTMRCGTMAVDPEFRGTGVSKRLMELHREEAVKQGCKQLFLEVIVGNDRAINFYKKLGYEKIYDLYYYSLKDMSKLNSKINSEIETKTLTIEEFEAFAEKSSDVHINWQNDLDYIKMSDNQLCLGAFVDNVLIGAVSVNKNYRVSYLYVDKKHRVKRAASTMLAKAAQELNIDKLSSGFPNNASIIGFLKQSGFNKDSIAQYEMYVTL
ncbi:GNAT family N-acetyltransferase [Clostridium swellfunianum]|uniref:GNAT family N-acetyltransferase n=1 Tax=Clostridium swellfunianum TaxID=1367462 RepID=UPI00202FEAEC|nr:GNAT family N-acetyltransferase [Clostridium swellfunianum]MCM0650951.1 GNAT family N-acetyltransferase [Clostridium swellfunianum]